jgi:hypothetical protein
MMALSLQPVACATYGVEVTPDGLGSPVLQRAGTDYGQDFYVRNTGDGAEPFDLLGSVGPASSFLSIDSITGTGVSQGGVPDSAQVSAIPPGDSVLVSMWYTVASSTDGRVDTLYLRGRSVTSPATFDDGYAEVEFEADAPACVGTTFQFGDGKGTASETDDAELIEAVPDSNSSTGNWVTTDASAHYHSILSLPNVFGGGANQIPLGATINCATLTLDVRDFTGVDPTVYQLTESWVESEVSWNSRSTGVSWTDPGADGTTSRKTTPEGDFPFPTNGIHSMDVMTSVQNWSDGEVNAGWIFLHNSSNGADFYTSDYSVQASRPLLTIGYTPPAPTYAVTVTPDGLGAPVVRTPATGYSQAFVVTNGSTVQEDFDLLARLSPTVSFLTIDSITGTGVSQGGQPDSAQVANIAAGDSATVSLWYTVAASTDGRVDTLFLKARSVADTSVSDEGYAEVEVDSPATLLGRYWFNEAPEGQTPATVADDQANPLNLTMTYDAAVEWTVDSIHRALGASTDVHTGVASASAVGTKYTDSLESSTRATFVTVASFGPTGNTQRIGGFQTSGGTRVVTMLVLGDGRFTLRLATKTQSFVQIDWPNTWADSVRRTFHFVYDADNPADSLRLRLYVNGVDQGPGTLSNGTWPAAGEGLDFSNGTLTLALMNRATQDAGFGGNLHYYAVYSGQMTDAEITANSSALLADDDNLTVAVAVTPDGAAVTRQAGTDYSQDFTVTNNGTGLDAFDLLTSTGPASSFISVDSITGANVTQGGDPDSARVTDVASSGGSETVTVWYTVASSTGGRVDTLYLRARSITDTTVSDQGSLEVMFDEPAVALVRYWIDEAPSGQGVANLIDAAANPLNMPLSYPSTSTPIWDGGSGGNRHLSFDGTDGTDTGGGRVDVNGTKIDSIHGATNITVELKYMAEGCVGNDWRAFGISDGNSSSDGWLAVRERSLRDVLQVQWAGQTVGVYALETGCPITSASVVHWVVDTREATNTDRIRAYIDGVQATVTPIDGSTWPSQNETIDLGPGTRRMFVGRPWDGIRTMRGRIWYAALYQGVLTNGQIASQVTALTASDDNNTYAVAVTPDGQAVTRPVGTGYSEDFTVTNNSSVLEDFNLAARLAPVASFITVDSITGSGVTQGATADSARVNGIAASGAGTVPIRRGLVRDRVRRERGGRPGRGGYPAAAADERRGVVVLQVHRHQRLGGERDVRPAGAPGRRRGHGPHDRFHHRAQRLQRLGRQRPNWQHRRRRLGQRLRVVQRG